MLQNVAHQRVFVLLPPGKDEVSYPKYLSVFNFDARRRRMS